MKKLLLLAVCIAGALSAYGQGTVNFANVAGTVNAPVFDVDGTTRLDGDQYMAQLLIDGTEVATTPFLTGGSAGYFLGGNVDAGVDPGTEVTATIRAWDTATGATWDAASIKGETSWQYTVVGNPAGSPPAPANALEGMQSFQLVPEPSTIALAVLGGAFLLFRRRK